ncbi:metal ABC transporter permease [Propioniciclava sp. MC1595]|uniref:metal ABC transporter permease n=1 Tax=Propioniciclava sp. MC1595 TaxID=2760308 RepID=UPI0016621E9A|nr:metal ABC transporter permease [Propioniciclava sp. MC1595]MBB1493536.1 metal ABC transporter permease [Propioniciclava sp. MC1595]QTE26929.1 metal ABC transporter permease [Propioniciclava sp. MC1595]
MDWFLEPFLLGFQQRALIGGLAAGVMSSVVGVWLVLRGMSFFGDAFVHGVLPGIAAATIFGFNPYLGAAVAAIVMVGGIELIHRQTALKEDTAIGLLFVGMMALGVAIISKSSSYTGSLTNILFGDIFGVNAETLTAMAVLGTPVLLGSLLLYRPLLALSFSPTKAKTLGMSPRFTHAALLVLIATAVIASFQAVGTLLVFALLVGPPATAALVTRTIPQMFVTSVVLASFTVWLGLVLSYHWGTAGAATIALVAIALFFLVLTVRPLFRSTLRQAQGPGATR